MFIYPPAFFWQRPSQCFDEGIPCSDSWKGTIWSNSDSVTPLDGEGSWPSGNGTPKCGRQSVKHLSREGKEDLDSKLALQLRVLHVSLH